MTGLSGAGRVQRAAAEDRTPRPWDEAASPTPEQLADWLEVCTREERVELCGRMLDSAALASRCFMEQHSGLREEVAFLSRRASDAYERGYQDAVAKALADVESTADSGLCEALGVGEQ